jgi:hypothetical protein
MPKSYTIIEKSQPRGPSTLGGWWYVLHGKFDTMAPLSFVGQTGTITLKEGGHHPIEVVDTQLRNSVLSVKLDGIGAPLDGHAVGRPAQLTLGTTPETQA